ncbi:CopG family transcriptional regulator, partial [Microbacterium sp.]|uniref:CopG family transcriptional regulator n=1 Tax=Microbacterium sp. TaxID=51671 RepID=UPI003A83BAE4
MRTTIELDNDTAKAVEQLRREFHVGASDAVNTLIRRGLLAAQPSTAFTPITRDLGLRIDVSNIADALEILEGP